MQTRQVVRLLRYRRECPELRRLSGRIERLDVRWNFRQRSEVEAHVEEGRAREEGERLPQHAFSAQPIEVAHREHAHVEVADQLALAVVERADADQRGAHDRGRRPGLRLEGGARGPFYLAERAPAARAARNPRESWSPGRAAATTTTCSI